MNNQIENSPSNPQQIISLHKHIKYLMDKRDSFPSGTQEHGFFHFEVLEKLRQLYYMKIDFEINT